LHTAGLAPIDGIAGFAQAQVGDLVSTSSGTLTTISTLDPIRDYFTVSEQEYLALRKQLSGSNAEHRKLSSSWPTGGHIRMKVSFILRIARSTNILVPSSLRRSLPIRAMFCGRGSTGESLP
jgi:multidrug efflux pump subunit AcrA (membrane-fusion protein)